MNKQVNNKNATQATGLTALTVQDIGLTVDVNVDVSYAIWVRALIMEHQALEYGLVLQLDLEYRLDSFHVHLTYQKLQQPQ